MGGAPLAIQDNYTGFGDSVLPPNAGNVNCMQVAFDDSNVLGVTETNADDPGSAETGMEYDIPFADLGLTPVDQGGEGTEIRIMAVLTGSRGYLSNQFLPPLGLGNSPNLGDASLVNLNTFPGNQYLGYTLTAACGSDPADIDGNGVVDGSDITTFVSVLLGTNLDLCPLQKSEFFVDGERNGLDIQGFVDAFLAS